MLALSSPIGCTQHDDHPLVYETFEEPTLKTLVANGRAGKTDTLLLERRKVDDSKIKVLSEDDDWIKTLQFDAGVISDSGVAVIATLPSLRHLRLRHSPVTDAGLKRLSRCRSLQILNLPHCQATAQGIAELASLPSMINLRLGGNTLGPETAQAISSIKTLRHLHLIGVPIDDQGLEQIALLPELESLYVDDAEVSSEGWDWLFENHSELHVHVNQNHLDRDPGNHE